MEKAWQKCAQATADELVYQAVIDWEDSYRDAISRGMQDFTYQQRLVVYKKLVTPRLREALILQDFDSEGGMVRLRDTIM